MKTLVKRRELLRSAVAGLPLAAAPALARALLPGDRQLSFFHTHTGESLNLTYRQDGSYLPDSLAAIDHLLRDFRTGEIHAIDVALLDLLEGLRELSGGSVYEVISGYRSPVTNAMLRQRDGQVAQRSLHMQGQAIDVRLRGVATNRLREAALAMRAGGVGYYPESDFIHVDTGRVRFW